MKKHQPEQIKLRQGLLDLRQEEHSSLDAWTIWKKHQESAQELRNAPLGSGMRYSILADVLSIVLIAGFMLLVLFLQEWSSWYLALLLGIGSFIYLALNGLLSRDRGL